MSDTGNNEPIAVIGSGCRFPGRANTPSRLWELLKEPRDVLSKIHPDRFDVDSFYHPDGDHHGRTNARHSYLLDEDVYAFDASFFNINPHEADAIDPQHRLLLETVYEGISSAGLRVEDLQGSPTAVYVGMMQHDFADITNYDVDSIPTYAATGTSACILSNRISYFFDWNGPSMTIDTACSSSLVAVDLAVQQLRSGASHVAVAAGANLILGPLPFIVESKLHMLSPTGRSRMWDEGADGYARGEGVAAVVLKTLSQALKDGNTIECIIRESGVNQDGKTVGITMPNHKAQEALIRETYKKAGLDLSKPGDRCQYFEAHGTGTSAGDPQEAEAISSAFFGHRKGVSGEDKLLVGSIKTVIGHTEGTAGIAGLMKASFAVQHGIIPPNLLFEKLNPKVAPFYKNLQIVTEQTAWPDIAPGQPRRASVNSFGFGGTNAHLIIENYQPSSRILASPTDGAAPCLAPITLSANTESSLKMVMRDLAQFLKTEPDVGMRDLAWTLLKKRSVLPVRRAIAGQTIEAVRASLEAEATLDSSVSSELQAKPSVLGIFTGQGAQWPAMGKVLVSTVPHARDIIAELDKSLYTLPTKYKPNWTLHDQLLLEGEASNVNNARFSQPLCCAVQILLVQLLRASGVKFKAVLGHSSGEIACAYAAGFITSSQAIRIAYLRGVMSELAASPSGAEGAMMAVGTSLEDAQELCALEDFEGRISVAASNSPDSVTLSGDKDAIMEAQETLDSESKFARILKIDKAYHSHHMLPCVTPYVEALKVCGCDVPKADPEPSSIWISSVHDGKVMRPQDLRAEYWGENLASPVLFSQAVEEAMIKLSPLNLAIEIGAHPALKNPCLATIENCTNIKIPYTGVMERKKDDTAAFAAGLGYIWEHFGSSGIEIQSLFKTLDPSAVPKDLAKSLPSYPFDHSRSFKKESRATKLWLRGEAKTNLLLGKLSAHSTPTTMQWQRFFKPTDMDWIDGHALQGQTVFPGAGYVVMAMEAALHVAGDREVRLIEVMGLKIDKAVTFEDENSLVELNLTAHVHSDRVDANQIVLDFAINACLARETSLSTSASGQVILEFGTASLDALPTAVTEPAHMNKVSIDSFYKHLDGIGYGYTKEFRGIQDMKRADSKSCGTISWPKLEDENRNLVMHPASLDVAFQAFIGAYSAPGDGRLQSLLVPTQIDRISLNPWLATQADVFGEVGFNSATMTAAEGNRIGGDIEVFALDTRSTILHVEGLQFKPFSPPSAADDHAMFSKWVWGPLSADRLLDDEKYLATQKDKDVTVVMERITYFYIKAFLNSLNAEDRENAAPHYHWQINWCEHIVAEAREGRQVYYNAFWEKDTVKDIHLLIQENVYHPHVRLLQRVGENILIALRENKNAFDIMDHDGLLTEFYGATESYGMSYRYFEQLVGQIGHRYQSMDILEIGGGTGGATKYALGKNQNLSFNSYTFTDISSAFFDNARQEFQEHSDKMDFKTLDIRRDPEEQEYTPHSYDLIIASNVLHATPKLEETLANARKLLKPGGHLVIIEVTHREHSRIGFIFGMFADWWAGVDEGRVLEPFVSIDKWDEMMKRTGFSGIESRTADPDPNIFPNSVFSTHAVDAKMRRLAEPLTQPPKDSYAPLVIAGSDSPRTAKIVQDLKSLMPNRPFEVIQKLQDIREADIEPRTAFIVLSELDDELFNGLNEEKFEAMQSLFSFASHILWVTEDAWVKNPYQAMSIGLLRSLRLEHIDVQIQCLDVQDIQVLDSRILAEQFYRLEEGSSWLDDGILWTQEPELYLSSKKELTIPRLKSDVTKNNRLNSSRRPILADLDPTKHMVSLCQIGQDVYLEANDDYSLPETPSVDLVKVQVQYASANAFRISSLGFFYLIQGTTSTLGPVVALAETCSSQVEIPLSRIIPLKSVLKTNTLVLPHIIADLLAQTLLSQAAEETTILIYEPPKFCIEALKERAELADVNLKFASLNPPPDSDATLWIKLHQKETQRGLISKLPPNVSALYDLSSDQSPASMGHRLSTLQPAGCSTYRLEHLVQSRAAPASLKKISNTCTMLEKAVKAAGEIVAPLGESSAIPASLLTAVTNIETVVQWNADKVLAARLRPIDSSKLFVDNKTYLLVGLAGDLGRSMCRWMIEHGARHVVLSSRYPKVEQKWIEDIERIGGNVMILPMDVSIEASLDAGLAKIRASMPAIAGVAFGPLVLQDILFKNMELDMMEMVLAPKMKGAQLLDKRLSRDTENPLDFFVMFSSFVMVSGNPGQAAYSAANAYTHALANQRRARGQAASTIDIGAVYGVGFIARAGREEEYDVVKFMFDAVSEQELQTLFGEAVVAGRSKTTDSIELVTGMPFIDPINRDRIPYFNDPRLSYFKLTDRRGDGGDATAAQGSVKDLLLTATTMEQVRDIVIDGFAAKLRSAMQLGSEDSISVNIPLVDQGVDSLIVVTIGAWFSKNLGLEIPLLKILGGACVIDLVDESIVRLLPAAIPLVRDQNAGPVQNDGKPPSLTGATTAEASSYATSSSARDDTGTPLSSRPLSPEHEDGKVFVGRREALSLGQDYSWKLQQLSIEPVVFNSTIGMFMKGAVDLERLANAFNTALQRHDVFRTRFVEDAENPGSAVQVVMRVPHARFEVVKVADRGAAEEGLRRLEQYEYDLAKGDTLKIVNFTWSSTDHLLIIAYHRLVGDGWTTERLFVEAGNLYNGVHLDKAPSYVDFALRQRQQYEMGQMSDDLAYWESLYATTPVALPIMSLPQAQEHKNPSSWKHHEFNVRLNSMVAIRLRERSRKHKATPMQFYLTAYHIVLARLTGNTTDISIAIADTNRPTAEDMATMGYFANLLPVRLEYAATNTFGETLIETREQVRKALLHSSVPYSVMLDRLGLSTATPEASLSQAVFDYKQGQAESGSIGGAQMVDTLMSRAGTPYDVVLEMSDDPTKDPLITVKLQTSLYGASDAKVFADAYLSVLSMFSRNPALRVDEGKLDQGQPKSKIGKA